MKIPSTFLPETQRKELEKEIEEIINNTLIDKALIEKIGEELKEYLESKTLAEAFKILFKKTIDLSKDGSIKTVTQRRVAHKDILSFNDGYDIDKLTYFYKPKKVIDRIQEEKESSIKIKETTSLLEEIRDLEPCLKEENIMHDYENSFSIVTKDFIYDMILNTKNREYKYEETSETTTVGRCHKRTVPIIKAYCNPIVEGSIEYVKFNQEHNEKIIKALKKRGYKATIDIKTQ
ncbi:MAG: hypothetical protein Q8N77_01850 [Nanoarchaeota archaeon]|nr:hypothetical protein [Nanoarchaeota archaeon]